MVRRLRRGVWFLELGFHPPFDSNAYLLDEGRLDGPGNDVVLVDAGLWYNSPDVTEELKGVGYRPGDIDRVLLTHYDLDHVGGLDRLVPEFAGPVSVGRADHDLLTGVADPPWLHHKGLFHRASRRLFPLPELRLEPVDDGAQIGGFTAYHTPGHNPGHTVYYHAGASTVFLGDLVWGDEEWALTTPFWGDSYDMVQLRASVSSLAERIPDFDVAAMGHGEPLLTGGSDELRALATRL